MDEGIWNKRNGYAAQLDLINRQKERRERLERYSASVKEELRKQRMKAAVKATVSHEQESRQVLANLENRPVQTGDLRNRPGRRSPPAAPTA